jgi:hypothetical protein
MGRVLKPGGHLIYSDFIAPAGRRFPTRQGITGAAASQGLERTQNNRSLFHYTAYFRKHD